jgi:hypothetical protein
VLSCNLAGAPIAFIAYVTVCRQVNVICLSQVTSSIVFIPVNLNLILHPSTSHMTVSSWRIAISFVLKPLEFGNACHQLACEDNDNADALMELFLIRDNVRSYNLPNLTLQVQDGFMMLLLLVAKDSRPLLKTCTTIELASPRTRVLEFDNVCSRDLQRDKCSCG